MKIELTETELQGALDFWLHEMHPTLIDARKIGTMTIETYPARVTLTLESELETQVG